MVPPRAEDMGETPPTPKGEKSDRFDTARRAGFSGGLSFDWESEPSVSHERPTT